MSYLIAAYHWLDFHPYLSVGILVALVIGYLRWRRGCRKPTLAECIRLALATVAMSSSVGHMAKEYPKTPEEASFIHIVGAFALLWYAWEDAKTVMNDLAKPVVPTLPVASKAAELAPPASD